MQQTCVDLILGVVSFCGSAERHLARTVTHTLMQSESAIYRNGSSTRGGGRQRRAKAARSMNLPNLSHLSIEAKLFEHVALRGGGKHKCRAHKEPILTKDDADPTSNCAVDGYLMFKPVLSGATESPTGRSGTFIDVVVDGQSVQLQPLLKRTDSKADRKNEFEFRHQQWIRDTFPLVCARGAGLPPVTWESYGKELAGIAEWYFLDEVGQRGHLFLQLLDTPQYKLKMHMPTGGVFEGRYLYVALVCAAGASGYGKFLMKVAEAVSRRLGCDGVALASLSNSAGFYYSLGYMFVSKLDGAMIDVEAWTEQVRLPDGRLKTMLRPEREVDSDELMRVRPLKRDRDGGAGSCVVSFYKT